MKTTAIEIFRTVKDEICIMQNEDIYSQACITSEMVDSVCAELQRIKKEIEEDKEE